MHYKEKIEIEGRMEGRIKLNRRIIKRNGKQLQWSSISLAQSSKNALNAKCFLERFNFLAFVGRIGNGFSLKKKKKSLLQLLPFANQAEVNEELSMWCCEGNGCSFFFFF